MNVYSSLAYELLHNLDSLPSPVVHLCPALAPKARCVKKYGNHFLCFFYHWTNQRRVPLSVMVSVQYGFYLNVIYIYVKKTCSSLYPLGALYCCAYTFTTAIVLGLGLTPCLFEMC